MIPDWPARSPICIVPEITQLILIERCPTSIHEPEGNPPGGRIAEAGSIQECIELANWIDGNWIQPTTTSYKAAISKMHGP